MNTVHYFIPYSIQNKKLLQKLAILRNINIFLVFGYFQQKFTQLVVSNLDFSSQKSQHEINSISFTTSPKISPEQNELVLGSAGKTSKGTNLGFWFK